MSLSKMLQEYREGLRGLPTYEELAAIAEINSTAAPQVVADERAAFDAWWRGRIPEGGDSLHATEFAYTIWSAARAAAPVQPVAVPDGDPRPLFDRKLLDLQRRGYEIIGRILHKEGQYALFDSSCRWLEKAQYQRLMHEQDGSLFSAPAAQGDAKKLTDVHMREAYYIHCGNSAINWGGREWTDFVGGWRAAIAAKA